MRHLSIKIKLLAGCLAAVSLLTVTQKVQAQSVSTPAECLNRAQDIYAKIWQDYRVPAYKGLFSENYPADNNAKLDYLQGDKVNARVVSFLWPFSGVMSATNALMHNPSVKNEYQGYLDSLVTGMEKYKDTSRIPTGYQAYPVMFEHSDRYYDDNGLVGTEYIEAYFNTKNPVYLNRTKTVFKFIISGWSNELGGGIYWLEGHHDQKPACSNGMALIVALKLYQATKDPYYLNWGLRFYNWMHTNLRNPDGLYYNDIKVADGKTNPTYWTYNSGAVLEASVMLYQFTGEHKYLAEAQFMAKNIYQHFHDDKHDAHLNMRIDLPWFVAVLFRGYEALYRVDKNPTYIVAIHADLDYAWKNTRDQYGFTTHDWTTDATEIKKPKWLLDEACIAELYARLANIGVPRHK
ncbi:MAG: glycoside hydrolase family 76 protein [Sphingobacteriales bacterium]